MDINGLIQIKANTHTNSKSDKQTNKSIIKQANKEAIANAIENKLDETSQIKRIYISYPNQINQNQTKSNDINNKEKRKIGQINKTNKR